jgi:predicted dehydrogenase
LTRRRFLKAAGAGVVAPWVIASTALGAAGRRPASERITGGHIGCGSRGGSIRAAGGQLVAVCDPWQDRRERWAAQLKCNAYRDFRELLARDDIDVVVIAAPDHWHVPMTVAAAKAGKDIYCEKPLGTSIYEDQVVRAAVHRYGRVFQFGTQFRSNSRCRLAAELVRNGKLGRLREIEVYAPGGQSGDSAAPVAVPDGLDWDLWLGPAPWRPYNGGYARNGFGWFFVYDFSLGFIAGYSIHPTDQVLWAFDSHLHGPFEVEGAGAVGKGAFDTIVEWDARVTFANGVFMKIKNDKSVHWRFVGSEGSLHVTYSHTEAQPASLLTELGREMERRVESRNHGDDFLEAVRTRRQPAATIDDAFRADVICQLVDIAVRLGRKITWDPVKEEIVGDDQASRLLCRPMREPWRL